MELAFWCASLAILLLTLAWLDWLRMRRANRPPGPRPMPFIGNLLDLPSSFQWETFAKWGQKYGDLVSVSVPGSTVVIVNSYSKAIELMDTKGAIYSDRPYAALSGELMGFDRGLGLLPYGPKLKIAKKLFSRELGSPSRIAEFHRQLENQSAGFIQAVASNPSLLFDHVDFYASSIMLRIAYGYQPTGHDDVIMRTSITAVEKFTQSVLPGEYLCNQVPILRYIPDWFPGAAFKKLGAEGRRLHDLMNERPFNFTKSEMAQGTAEESFVSKALKRGLPASEQIDLMFASGTMFAAGNETIAVTLHVFFLILGKYPEIQKRAQAEVESVCKDKVPVLADKDSMPYLEAVTKEVLRFHQIVPLGLPHATLEDDIHDGYYIPKGATVLANIWYMCHDPEVYQDPFAFNPERFLGPNPEQDPREMIFGFGRRACVGRLLAEAALFITESMALWCFDISPLDPANPPEYKMTSAAGSHIEPVQLKIVPRGNRLDSLATL